MAKTGKFSVKKKADEEPGQAKTKSKDVPSKEEKQPRESASALFKELILKGEKTDDEIFATVQKKYNLDDNKRKYVAWYRNALKKEGIKVPAKVIK